MNQWGVIWSVRDSFIAGLFATLELFITAALAALIIGIALCYFSEYQKKVINRIIIGFVSLMRAIPFLILAYLLYYGLPQLGISMEPWTAGLLALIIYHGAYSLKYCAASGGYFPADILKRRLLRAFLAMPFFGGLFYPISSLPPYR